MEVLRFEKEIAGRNLIIEIGRLAQQANASCTVRYGDTVVLATVVLAKTQREGLNFFPLLVDYEERLYAAGKIKGSRFIKREGRPSDEAIINARMVDRAIRPLFDDKIRNDVQVILTILSYDPDSDPSVVSLIAASTALAISDIPWQGPIAGIKIGLLDNKFVANPNHAEIEKSDLNLVIAGTPDKIIMIESDSKEIEEKTMFEAIKFGQKYFKDIINLIGEAVKMAGKDKTSILNLMPEETEESLKQKDEVLEEAKKFISDSISEFLYKRESKTKALRKSNLEEIKVKLEEHLKDKGIEEELVAYAMSKAEKLVGNEVSKAILEKGIRVDGRKLNQIRPIDCQVGLLPRTHGSGLFSRGETQILSIVTLGSPGEVQILETLEEESKKRYMHHYNFPPFSTGEVAPIRMPGRREIGHGILAEKALAHVIPPKEEFPYTIRVVSEVLSSNGSSSMGSICGSTLALMDAGVPLKKPVAGIAMGLASDKKGNYRVFTDLQDLEDSEGGMDFKVAGTRDGITAIQMDTKSSGLTDKIIEETLKMAKEARMEILEAIQKTISAPRPDLSPYAPRITSFYINPEKIRDVIGPGGKMINKIIEETGVTIDVEQDGLVMVTSTDAEKATRAVLWIKDIVKEVESGEIYNGKVVRIMDFGAFVEILPGKDGMIHISKMAPFKIAKVTDVLNIGDEVKVKVDEIDSQGRINLSLLEGGKKPVPARGGFKERRSRRPSRFGRKRY